MSKPQPKPCGAKKRGQPHQPAPEPPVSFADWFRVHARKCRWCQCSFIPAKGRQEQYCCDAHLDLAQSGIPSGTGDVCLDCGAALPKRLRVLGTEVCARCNPGGEALPLDLLFR